LQEEKPQKRKKIIASESESNNEMAVCPFHSLEQISSAPNTRVAKKLRKRSSDNSDVIAQKQEYQRKVKWLNDHEEMTGEEVKDPGEEVSGNETSSSERFRGRSLWQSSLFHLTYKRGINN
jgi:hypothetical protein